MNTKTLNKADIRIKSPKKVLILDNGDHIRYEEMDFMDAGNNPDHVWLYENGIAFACIDLECISGVMDED